jgi:hypothetical protein
MSPELGSWENVLKERGIERTDGDVRDYDGEEVSL